MSEMYQLEIVGHSITHKLYKKQDLVTYNFLHDTRNTTLP